MPYSMKVYAIYLISLSTNASLLYLIMRLQYIHCILYRSNDTYTDHWPFLTKLLVATNNWGATICQFQMFWYLNAISFDGMVFGVNLFPNKKEVNLNFFFDFIGFYQATQTGEKNRCRMCVILFDSFFFCNSVYDSYYISSYDTFFYYYWISILYY